MIQETEHDLPGWRMYLEGVKERRSLGHLAVHHMGRDRWSMSLDGQVRRREVKEASKLFRPGGLDRANLKLARAKYAVSLDVCVEGVQVVASRPEDTVAVLIKEGNYIVCGLADKHHKRDLLAWCWHVALHLQETYGTANPTS